MATAPRDQPPRASAATEDGALEERADERLAEIRDATFDSEMALLGVEAAVPSPSAGRGGPAAADARGIERYRVPVGEAPAIGASEPLVTIVVFSDFECPFCGRVLPTLERLRSEYPDDVQLVFRHNPLPFHTHADLAAQAAIEAHAQGGDAMFWRFHDLLFENQRALAQADLERYAREAGMSVPRLRRALRQEVHRDTIDADQALASKLDARGTPSFFINGRPLSGAQPFAAFDEVVREELRAAGALVEDGTARTEVYAALLADAPEVRRARRAAPGQRQIPDPAAVYRVPVDGAPSLGRRDALVTMVVFSDFECPFCGRVQDTLEELRDRYGRELRIVFRHNPLDFHPHAMAAAEAAHEAYVQRGAQGFWAMHDLLFAHQRSLERADLERYAAQLRLDLDRFRRALDRRTHRARIEADQALARGLGATGTPSFFVNGRLLRGAQPSAAFVTLIDDERDKASGRVAAGTPRARVYASIIESGATTPQLIDGPDGGPPTGAPSGAPPADARYELSVPGDAPSLGPARAPVTIQMFTDFECPFCERVRGTVETLLRAYPRRVRLVFRHYPLPFHRNAALAHEAAWEVLMQKGNRAFWRYQELLFDHQRDLGRDTLERLARRIRGLDMARFERALDRRTHRPRIERDQEAIRGAGARIGTPSFFVNGRLVQGAQPYPVFEQAVERALTEGDPLRP